MPRVLTFTEGSTRTSMMTWMGRSAGVLRPWHAGRDASKNLGDPSGSWHGKTTGEGIRILRHGRRNPDTGLSRSLMPVKGTCRRKAEKYCKRESLPDAVGESYQA